jgi:hypothetical protein
VRRTIGVLIGVAIVALAIVWCGRDRDEPATRSPSGVSSPVPRGDRAAPSIAGGDELPTVTRAQELPIGPERSPYPPNSQPLTEGSDPATAPPEDDPVDPESGVHVVFGPRRDIVHPPDAIVIDLQVLDASGKRLAIRDGRAYFPYFRGERDTASSGTGARATFVDDGGGGDRVAGDLAYAAALSPSRAEQQALLGFRVFVEVAFELGGPHRFSTWVQYTPRPHASLDRTFVERVDAGSLVVDVGLDVVERGRYKVIASLYGADRATAICFAQEARVLERGKQSVPLVFFGKILRDRGVDGPYVLRYAMVFEEFPERGVYWPGDTVDDAYTTRSYRATDFSPEPYAPRPSDEPAVTATSPSQQGKPPPLFTR